MVDYSKIRAGDTVKFRCGGSAVVQEGYFFGHAAKLKFAGSDDSIHYDLTHHRTSVFDVVEVIPKPFEWKDLKPGMAFKYREQTVYYCFSDNRGTRHYSMESFSCPQIIYPDIGDRVPQYDVKGIS